MKTVSFSDDENRLCRRILRLTAEGRPKDALRYYEQELSPFLESATTHHAAFVAARESGLGREQLDKIENRAMKCADYDSEELNFARDWALHYIEVERDVAVAEISIAEVIRSRQDDEGQDYAQLRADRLARCKILLLKGETFAAMKDLNRIRGWRENQTSLDIEWWFFVANLLLKNDEFTILLAQRNLREGRDPKQQRRRAWAVASWQWEFYPGKYLRVGPFVARLIVKRQLGL